MMKKTLVSIVVLGMVSLLNAKTTKDIQVVSTATSQEDSQSHFDTQRGVLFNFATPASKKVKVGEPIKVAFKLKHKAYIYLIAVSEKNDKAYMILPNKYEGYNLYKPNTHYVVPERSADYKFISDSDGKETIYLIASTHKQSFESLLNKFGSEKAGHFRTTSAKNAQKFMKDIIVVPANASKKKVEVRKLEVEVYGDKPTENVSTSSTSSVRVFLSTGKTDYKVGESVSTMIQSDQAGYVSIFVKNPDDSVDYMTTLNVKKNQSEIVKFQAEDKGVHQLIVYFNEKEPKDPKEIVPGSQQGNSKGSKALTLVSESKKPIAVNRHTINVHK